MSRLPNEKTVREIVRNALFWPQNEALRSELKDNDNCIIDIVDWNFGPDGWTPDRSRASSQNEWYEKFLKNVDDYDWPHVGAYDYHRYWGDGSLGGAVGLTMKFTHDDMKKDPESPKIPGGMTFARSVASMTFLTNLMLCLPGWNRNTPGSTLWSFNSDIPYAMRGERIFYAISKLLLSLRPPGKYSKSDTEDPWRKTFEKFAGPQDLVDCLLAHKWSTNGAAEAIILLHLLPKVFTKLTPRLSLKVDDPEAAISGHLELLRFASIDNAIVDLTSIKIDADQQSNWWPYNARQYINSYYDLQNKDAKNSSQDALKLRSRVVEFVKDIQRMTVLTTDCPWLLVPLIEQGISSAYGLASISEAELFNLVYSSEFYIAMSKPPMAKPPKWEDKLREVYGRAISITSRNQHAYLEITQYLRGAGMRVIDGDASTLKRRDALSRALRKFVTKSSEGSGNKIDDLVGIIDTYNVEEAYTVHSPAAYFVELLDALPGSARNLLFQRRPDIRSLHLSAANTFTALPYLDLAIETMESFLSSVQNTTALKLVTYNTDPDTAAQDLEAEPRNGQSTLYSLTGPCNTPAVPFQAASFDLGIEETRRLLKALKVTRSEMMETFCDPDLHANAETGSTQDQQTIEDKERTIRQRNTGVAVRRAAVAEYLHLSPADYVAITKETFLPAQYWEELYEALGEANNKSHIDPEYQDFLEDHVHRFPLHVLWGYPSREALLNLGAGNSNEYHAVGLGFLTDRFLPISGLSVSEWLLLIKSDTCRHLFRPFTIKDGERLPTSPQYCIRMEPDHTESHWHKLQAFLRLRSKLGISIPELDLAVGIFQGFSEEQDRFGAEFLSKVADMLKIQKLVDIELLDLLMFWGDVPQDGKLDENVIYQQFFNSKRLNRIDRDFTSLANMRFKDENQSYRELKDFQIAVAAMTSLSQADLLAVYDAIITIRKDTDGAMLPGINSADNLWQLNVPNATILLRCATLIRAAEIQAGALVHFLTVFPDVFASPSSTLDVLTFWIKARSRGLTIESLRFVVEGGTSVTRTTGPQDAELLTITSALLQELTQSETNFSNAGIDQVNNLQQTLTLASAVFKREEVAEIKNVLLGLATEDEVTHTVSLINQRMLNSYGQSGQLQPSLQELLLQLPSPDDDEKREKLLVDKADKLYDFMTASVRASQRKQAVQSVVQKVAGSGDLEMANFVFQNLVQVVLPNPTSSTEPDSETSSEREERVANGVEALLSTFSQPSRQDKQSWEGFLQISSQDAIFFTTADATIAQNASSTNFGITIDGVPYPWTQIQSAQPGKSSQKPPDALYMAGPFSPTRERLIAISLPPGDIKSKVGQAAVASIPPHALISKTALAIMKSATEQLSRHTTLFSALGLNTSDLNVLYSFWSRAQTVPSRSRTQINSHRTLDLQWTKDLERYVTVRASIDTIKSGSKNKLLGLMTWIDQANHWREVSKDSVSDDVLAEAEKWKITRSSLSTLAQTIADIIGCSNLNLESVLAVACGSRNPEVVLENLRRAKDCYFRFLEMVHALLRFGLSGTSSHEVFEWARPYGFSYYMNGDESDATAKSIKKQVRMAVSTDDWNKISIALNNELREGKRDALIPALLRHPVVIKGGVRDANGLFDFLLVDTQMSPALKTSRIKQAISVVQNFTQRCLLELETDPITNNAFNIDQNQWQWLQKYRVWEANRRVYLTPETWLSMSTLDVKSEIMATFESNLSQGVIEWDTAANALSQYILALNEVSDLVYVAQYLDEHDNGQHTLHMFARTRSIPAIFYYRTRHNLKGYTPWQKMDLDIMTYSAGDRSGQYLIPWIRKGRLFLFLPEFKFTKKPTKPADLSGMMKEQKTSSISDSVIGTEAVEISFAWSEFRNGAWSKKTILGATYVDSWTTYPAVKFKFTNPESHYGKKPIASSLMLDRINYPIPDQQSLLDRYQFHLADESEGILSIPIIRPTPLYDYELVVKAFETSSDVLTLERAYILQVLEISKGGGRNLFDNRISRFNPCEFKINLIQLDCEVINSRQYYNAPSPDTSFCLYTERQIVNWPRGGLDPLQSLPPKRSYPTIANDGYPETHVAPKPYTSVLTIETSSGKASEPLCNDTAHVLVETAATTNAMKAVEVLSSLQADFGRKSSEDAEYSLLGTAYGIYSWELGLFIPMLLAERFLVGRRFDLALRAISLVFDPLNNPRAPLPDPDTTTSKPQDTKAPSLKQQDKNAQWKFLPFKQLLDINASATSIVLALADENARPTADESTAAFNPHAVSRARILSYMKWVVLRFVEILIEWADAKFRDDTLESLPEAIMLYTQASHIIGPRLQLFDKPVQRLDKTYASLSTVGFVTEFESMFPWDAKPDTADYDRPWLAGRTLTTEHFSIPAETKLMDLRDRVDDRLFKIRHSMDIKGMVRTLSLYEPQIDPGKLVRAFAAGSFNLANTLNDLNVPLVNVRFNRLVTRALSIVKDLRRFGKQYLEIIKAKDDQALATLLASQDHVLNKMRQEVAHMAVQTASSTMHSMNTSRELVENRMKHYFGLIGMEDMEPPKYGETFKELDNAPPKMISDDAPRTKEEDIWMRTKGAATRLKGLVPLMKVTAGINAFLPDPPETKEAPGGVGIAVKIKGLTEGLELLADATSAAAEVINDAGDLVKSTGEFKDRLRERKLEINEMGGQLVLLDQELDIQNTLVQMAQKEVEMLDRELDWNNFIADWQRATRVTNDSFYIWLQAEYHGVYYQTYSFAYDMAKKAEQALFMELGLPSMDPIIDFGCWDVSRNGLLAAEKLYNGLRKLEQAFSETRMYDFEITKKISIKSLDTAAFTTFTTTAPHAIEFWLPEELFDLDFPGHYKRRIRTVSIGIAADGRDISAELTLLKHKYRVSAKETNPSLYPEKQNNIALDTRFRSDGIPINAIGVTVGTRSAVQWVAETAAESSSGLFEINFGGDSYLPFEGAGVISKWRLEISPFSEIDPRFIKDMVMTIQYTASRGQEAFRQAVIGHVSKYISTVSAEKPGLGFGRQVRVKT